ncbi:SRPBCC family protein [Erythrobacter sp. THAF29]|uniref:SRPBCC family protein n=1 Tax=Erythrobacter sp. THAF29 TaxID=2587851 RepID=UPI0012A92F29|nr:SRPBCC family protein [Erythrobacter sp. THAF29]QFT78254.1 hypothetical protein FIU90_11955 [Erythrobacter sp. THAF29]
MRLFAITAFTALLASGPLAAEVIEEDDKGFVTRDQAIVEASPKQVWLELITPSNWWNDAHTWSGDAANMTIRPQAGGCFCEKIPETEEENRITLEGSVEHMRVIQAYPESALRMVGALGPLQSEPVTGILTIAISTVDEGTRIVWEYNVGGRMRYETPVISKAVDGVMTQQLDGLASKLGRVDKEPEPTPEPDEEAAEETDDGATEDAPTEEDDTPSVDEVFGDLSDEG